MDRSAVMSGGKFRRTTDGETSRRDEIAGFRASAQLFNCGIHDIFGSGLFDQSYQAGRWLFELD